MPARLISRVGKIQGDFSIGSEATLGRSSSNSIVLKPELLSNRHARIWQDSERGCYMLEDLGSSNGTRLDGERLRRSEPLGHLHVITLAEHYDFIFVDEQRSGDRHGGQGLAAEAVAQAVARRLGETSEVTLLENLPLALPGFSPSKDSSSTTRERTVLDVLPMPLPGALQQDGSGDSEPPTRHLEDPEDILSSPSDSVQNKGEASKSAVPGPARRRVPMPTIDLTNEPLPVKSVSPERNTEFSDTFFLEISTEEGPVRHRLKEGDNLVGRDPRADVRPSSPEVSRRHALFRVSPGRLTVKDLGSRNKTFVNGIAISDEVALSPGQELKLGALEARVLAADGWEEAD